MKRYQAIFVTVLSATLIYYQYSLNDKVNNIHETVVDTNETVQSIQTLLINTPYSLENDYHCLASNIYWESRNQSLGGKLAVGQVVLNRVEDKRFPENICEVVKQTKYYPSGKINLHDCQFSWYCDGKSDIPRKNEELHYEEAFELAVGLIEDRPIDITEGSTHYHNDKVMPYWADSLERITRIDNHIFYTEKK
tara:strand:+ start:767 stop:1348 length:582 start_codon:yes stop_codon:yes gene_type:complete